MRKNVLVYEMTEVGQTTVSRALFEAQRRWCPKKRNTEDEQYSVLMTTQDKVATMCDLRLCHGTHLNNTQQAETEEAFRTAYAEFARNAWVMEKCRESSQSPSLFNKSVPCTKRELVRFAIIS